MNRKKIKLVIMGLSLTLIGGTSLFSNPSANADENWRQVKARNFNVTEYRLKPSNSNQYVWNWQHDQVTSNLKNYPNSTWYIDQSVVLNYKGHNSIYYAITNKHNQVKQGGLIWNGYLTKNLNSQNDNNSNSHSNRNRHKKRNEKHNTDNSSSSNQNNDSLDNSPLNQVKTDMEKAINIAQIPNRSVKHETHYQGDVLKYFKSAYNKTNRISDTSTRNQARQYMVDESNRLFLKTNDRGNFTHKGQNYYENYSPLSRIPSSWNQLIKYMY